MKERLDPKKIEILPKAKMSDGFALCPFCWSVLCEPIEGKGKVAVWCRKCRDHVIVKME